MERGDIVELQNWSPSWDGIVAVVTSIEGSSPEDIIWICPIVTNHKITPNYARRAGFFEKQLKWLGHIDLPPEAGLKKGEKHGNRR